MTSAKTLLEDVLTAYNDQSLDFAGAASLAAISGQFLDEARAARKTSAADLLWGQALNVEADLQATLDKQPEALALARKAKDAALALNQTAPNAKEPLQVLYDASIRVGNALSAMGKTHYQDALQQYNEAVAVALKIAASTGDDEGDVDVIDAHMKLGDIYKNSGAKQHPQALAEYQSGLAVCEAALAKRPDSFDLLRNRGKAFFRIAELDLAEDAFDDGRAFYQKAADLQAALISRNAKEAVASGKAPDLSLKSNLAGTNTHWGMLERKAGKARPRPDQVSTRGCAQRGTDQGRAGQSPVGRLCRARLPQYRRDTGSVESAQGRARLLPAVPGSRSERSPSAGRDRRKRGRNTPKPQNWSRTIPKGCRRSTLIAGRSKSGAG